MKPRKVAGWSVLSLLPLGYFGFAFLTDKLAEALVGMVVGLGVIGVVWAGTNLAMAEYNESAGLPAPEGNCACSCGQVSE